MQEAEPFFRSLGYATVNRESVPEPIRTTAEFSTLCSATAVVMAKEL